MAAHMFHKQNKTSLSENWNEYRNGQSCNCTRGSRVLLRSDRYDTSSNFKTTMYYQIVSSAVEKQYSIIYVIQNVCELIN